MPGSPVWRSDRRTLVSFDRAYRAEVDYFAPDRYSFWDQRGYGISRGAGLSYAAASFARSAATVDHTRFNRLLDFDSASNVLEIETGATLRQIFDFAIRRDLFLATQPGHPSITVGGCIGADVHGKNQFRDGTFIAQVEGLRLRHPDHGILELAPTQSPDLFRLTCGGYGLTGNILSARIRLCRLKSHFVEQSMIPVDRISELPGMLARLAENADMIYSWHDFNASGNRFGTGFLVCAKFTAGEAGSDVSRLSDSDSSLDSPLAKLPLSFWNRLSLPAFNRIYRQFSIFTGKQKRVACYDFLFPVARKLGYFHLFGSAGFHECQIVVPADRFADFIEGVRNYLERHPVPISLASAKLFRGERELLRFTGNGICLALNFPRGNRSNEFAKFLDDLMQEHAAWPNLIKDSRLSAAVVAHCYPGYETFRQQLRDFDPHRRYRSELSDRLAL